MRQIMYTNLCSEQMFIIFANAHENTIFMNIKTTYVLHN